MHDAADRPSTRSKVFALVSPRKVALVVFGLALALGGFALGQIGEPESKRANDAINAAAEARGISRRDFTQQQVDEIAAQAKTTGRTAWQWMSPHLVRLGVSLAIGLVAGIFFRAFVVKAAALSALALAAIGGLAYFQVLDFSTWQGNYENVETITRDNASSVKDWAMSLAPSTTGAIVGFAFGFLRK